MNNSKPVDLNEKIEYLHEKIDHTNQQLKQGGTFELKMKFINFIDTTIENLYRLDRQPPPETIKKKHEEYYNAEENQKERRRIEAQKQQMISRLKEISQRQQRMEVQSLKIQIENSKIIKTKILNEANEKEKQLKKYIFELEKKIKNQEKQLQRLVRVNSLQTKEIDTIKEERNRAQKSAIDWKDRYDSQFGLIQAFGEKKINMAYRSSDGLKITRNITNRTNQIKGQERLFVCDLPIKFQIIKIAYGIKLGIMMPSKQIEYFQGVSLYQREEMKLYLEEQKLHLLYIKRKVVVKLDKYKPPKGQVILMLFGKGDSISIDESAG